jgi:S-adenosyl-L-methionine hydrolase (adenosine-forming)
MAQPIITLTTDFGLSDHYVGAMKGVILGICPRARIVDISHDVKPFAVSEAAYLIAQAYRHFPRGTVHVVVVDPGVGSDRRPILAEAAGQRFIAPDNGALGMILSREKHKVRVISNSRYFRKPVSATFHGRDIFAPVAAHVAAGAPVSSVGKLIGDSVRADFETPRRTGERAWLGCVLHIDRFGNVVTNFQAADFPDLGRNDFTFAVDQSPSGADLQVCAGPPGPAPAAKKMPATGGKPAGQPAAVHEVSTACPITALARTYSEHAPGAIFAIPGSSGYIEFSMNQASAAAALACAPGAPVKLTVH